MRLETGLSVFVCDADLVSVYPSIMRALNTSRMTLTFVPFKIEGKSESELRNYFSNLIMVRENAEPLCSEYHSLPTYETMAILVEAEI